MALGKLIVLEGIDGAGTTTQAATLVARIRASGRKAHPTREPSDGPIGVLIRQILKGRVVVPGGGRMPEPVDGAAVALLFAADRLDHLRAEIEPLLAAGVHVISDRYVLSSLAYQSLDASLQWVRTLNERAKRPDLTLFLDVPPKVALERRSDRGAEERFETLPLQMKIARAYKRILKDGKGLGKAITVDGTMSPEDVADAIWDGVAPIL